jgi:hypothetical protein
VKVEVCTGSEIPDGPGHHDLSLAGLAVPIALKIERWCLNRLLRIRVSPTISNRGAARRYFFIGLPLGLLLGVGGYVAIFTVWRAGVQVLGALDPNFCVNAWGGPSCLGASLAHWMDAVIIFNFRPPPLPKGASNSGVPAPGERRPRERPRSGPERPRPPHKSFGVSIARPRTSLPTDHRRTGQVFGRRPLEGEVGAAWSAPSDDRWRDLSSYWFLRTTPWPSCTRRARTRTCAPRAPRHQSARDSSRRRTPGPARPGFCTPCAGSSSDLQSGSPSVRGLTTNAFHRLLGRTRLAAANRIRSRRRNSGRRARLESTFT